MSSHIKIICHFTRENNMLIPFFLVTYCFNKYLDVLLYNQNIIRSSLEIYGKPWKVLKNVRKCLSGLRTTFGESLESVWKSLKNGQKNCHYYVYIIMRTGEISSCTIEEKFHIYIVCTPMYYSLYLKNGRTELKICALLDIMF